MKILRYLKNCALAAGTIISWGFFLRLGEKYADWWTNKVNLCIVRFRINRLSKKISKNIEDIMSQIQKKKEEE